VIECYTLIIPRNYCQNWNRTNDFISCTLPHRCHRDDLSSISVSKIYLENFAKHLDMFIKYHNLSMATNLPKKGNKGKEDLYQCWQYDTNGEHEF